MSFYNFYKLLLKNDKYLKNYGLVFINIENEDLQHFICSKNFRYFKTFDRFLTKGWGLVYLYPNI